MSLFSEIRTDTSNVSATSPRSLIAHTPLHVSTTQHPIIGLVAFRCTFLSHFGHLSTHRPRLSNCVELLWILFYETVIYDTILGDGLAIVDL